MARIFQDIECPGVEGKLECPTCTDRKIRITGKQRGKWINGNGESLKVYYVSTPCQDGNLIEQTTTFKAIPIRSTGQLSMKLMIHTKYVEKPTYLRK